MNVVDQQRERPVPREVGREPVERVAGSERVVRGDRARPVELEPEDRRGEACGAREQGLRLDRRVAQDLVEELPDDAERERALELRAAGLQCEQPRVGSRRSRGVEQRRLAHARRPVEHDQAADAVGRPRERASDGLELGVALEQPV